MNTTPLASPERSSSERSEPERSGGDANGAREPAAGRDDVEVPERPTRRRFDARFKLAFLAEVDACAPGGIGALLRREGLYSSHLITWRRQRDEGALAGLQPKRRGPKPKKVSAEARRYAQLERENQKLRHRLKQAETIIEFQKNCRERGHSTCWPETPRQIA
jgi:hypothetical protein